MKPRSIRCMKFFLTLFNLTCILFGLILVAVCVIGMKERKSGEAHSSLSRGVLSFLLTLGLCVVVTAVLGCIGALREHVRLLYVHAGFFIFLVSVEFLVGMGGAILSAWVGGGSEVRIQFNKELKTDADIAQHRIYFDNLQIENQCCGVDGPGDYASIHHRDVPASCCPSAIPLREGAAKRQLHLTCITDKSYFHNGCEDSLREKKVIKGHVFVITAIVFALIEIFCIVLAIWMGRTIKAERRKLQENLQAHFET